MPSVREKNTVVDQDGWGSRRTVVDQKDAAVDGGGMGS